MKTPSNASPQRDCHGLIAEGKGPSRREWLGATSLAFGAALAVGGGSLFHAPLARAAIKAVRIPAPAVAARDSSAELKETVQQVVLAGGCFWGLQLVYQHTHGVIEALSGYAGGSRATANYEDSSTGKTGHAQSVQLTFDLEQVSLAQLLHIYFSVAHDPTTVDRQHRDVGPQYRSAIFTDDPGQRQFAAQYIEQLNAAKVFSGPIVTQLNPLGTFYPAERYHQDYAVLHPDQPYIVNVDLPMVVNLEAMFPDNYRDTPVLVLPNPVAYSQYPSR